MRDDREPIELRVARNRQPDPVACLPTAVWTVLTYQGEHVSYDEVAAACVMDESGCLQELALQGLREAGWDIDVFHAWDEALVRAALEDDRPVVVSIALSEAFAHALVVCGYNAGRFTVLDPLTGEFHDLKGSELAVQVGRGLSGPFTIGGARPSQQD